MSAQEMDAAQALARVNLNYAWAGALVQELVRGGVRHVCLSPGSRSTPLVLSIAAQESLARHVHLDERSAAFFALGLARATGEPVALVCTSGSAGAHYLPALVEACHERLPLVVLTADRPVELQGVGAAQTTDQSRLFGAHVRSSAMAQAPHASAASFRHLRFTVQRLLAEAMGRAGMASPGPVHLNLPFREPLAPVAESDAARAVLQGLWQADGDALGGRAPAAPWLALSPSLARPHSSLVEALAGRLAAARRGVLVCGPMVPGAFGRGAARERFARGIVALSRRLGMPLMVDGLSGLRRGEGVVGHYEAFLRDGDFARAHAPDVLLRFGAAPTSKHWHIWRGMHPGCWEAVVDPHGGYHDANVQAAELLVCDAAALVEALLQVLGEEGGPAGPSPWWQAFARVEQDCARVQREHVTRSGEVLWEGALMATVLEALGRRVGQGCGPPALFVASSMPVRDLDSFGQGFGAGVDVYANRGVNGIDGNIATALGLSVGLGARVTAVVGDLSAAHDASSLLAAGHTRTGKGGAPSLDIVVVNNGGGGIFEHLPVAQFPEHFEELFLTPRPLDFCALARAYGAGYAMVRTPLELAQALEAPAMPGARLIEALVDRPDNLARHRDYWQACQLAAQAALGPGEGGHSLENPANPANLAKGPLKG